MTVYLVDLDYDTLKGYETVLLSGFPGIRVQCFTCIERLLQAVETKKPDAVFLEMEQPDSASAAQLLTQNKKVRNVIMVSQNDSYALIGARMGISGYLLKPVTAEKIAMQMNHLRQSFSFGGFCSVARPKAETG